MDLIIIIFQQKFYNLDEILQNWPECMRRFWLEWKRQVSILQGRTQVRGGGAAAPPDSGRSVNPAYSNQVADYTPLPPEFQNSLRHCFHPVHVTTFLPGFDF